MCPNCCSYRTCPYCGGAGVVPVYPIWPVYPYQRPWPIRPQPRPFWQPGIAPGQGARWDAAAARA